MTYENTIDVASHTHANPKDGPAPRSWLDKGIARLLALALAVVFGALLFTQLGDELMEVAGLAPAATDADDAPVDLVADPQVALCMEQRGGDVDEMLAQGVITEAQHTSFRNRAVRLCQSEAQVAPRG